MYQMPTFTKDVVVPRVRSSLYIELILNMTHEWTPFAELRHVDMFKPQFIELGYDSIDLGWYEQLVFDGIAEQRLVQLIRDNGIPNGTINYFRLKSCY